MIGLVGGLGIGTDLSLVFTGTNTDFPNLDCASVHIQAIMRRLGLNADHAR